MHINALICFKFRLNFVVKVNFKSALGRTNECKSFHKKNMFTNLSNES